VILNGVSLGDAVPKARHCFAQAFTDLDPLGLKTFAQFHLLWDPSNRAGSSVSHALSRTKTFKNAFRANQNLKASVQKIFFTLKKLIPLKRIKTSDDSKSV
jgi:hypothetical protein